MKVGPLSQAIGKKQRVRWGNWFGQGWSLGSDAPPVLSCRTYPISNKHVLCSEEKNKGKRNRAKRSQAPTPRPHHHQQEHPKFRLLIPYPRGPRPLGLERVPLALASARKACGERGQLAVIQASFQGLSPKIWLLLLQRAASSLPPLRQ